jgi:hypothetical protein
MHLDVPGGGGEVRGVQRCQDHLDLLKISASSDSERCRRGPWSFNLERTRRLKLLLLVVGDGRDERRGLKELFALLVLAIITE